MTWTKGGKMLESLQPQPRGHRRQILTENEEKLIVDFVEKKNADMKRVDYTDVHNYVVKKTKKDVALRTIQETGKELGISWKKTTRTLATEGKLSSFLFSNDSFLRSNISRSSD
jgi:transposase